MKKSLCLLLFCVLFSYTATAQTVMGIDIKTTMKNFNPQMAKKGYKPYKTVVGKYEYVVTFAGYPNCNCLVEYNTETDSIYWMEITFPHETIEKDGEIYREIKKQLTAKYGKPTSDFNEDYSDLSPAAIARLRFRNVSFNNGWPYMCWDFGSKNNVTIIYKTDAKSKVSKPSYSPDL